MRPRSLLNTTIIIGVMYVLSNLTGFGQRIIVTARFGTGAEYDAFNVASRIPELLFNLFAGGALASAFIPIFAGYLGKNERTQAWTLARYTAMLVFGVVAIGAAIAWLMAPAIVSAITDAGFGPAQTALAASLMRVMLVSTILFSVSGLLMGVLQSNGSFIAPAIAPSLYNLGIMFGALFLWPLGMMGVALGVVIGAAAHLAVQLPALFRTGARWQDTQGDLDEHDIRHVLALMIPRVIGLGASQINFLVNTRIASGMGEGAVSALSLAFAILLLPIAAIAQSIGTALFPTLSAHAARGEKDAFSAKITQALGITFALSAPATVGLILLGGPLVRLLFERGAFTANSTSAVSFALACYAPGLIGHASLEVTTRGFYAIKDTKRPVIVAVCGVLLNIALSLILARVFEGAGLPGFGGVALANSIATLIEAAWMLAWLRGRAGLRGLGRMGAGAAKSILASGVMGLALVAWLRFAGDGALATLAALVLAAVVYGAASLALGNDFIKSLVKGLTAR